MEQISEYDLYGKLHGNSEIYYRNGTLGWKGRYFNGIIRGLEKYWNTRGIPIEKIYNLVIK